MRSLLLTIGLFLVALPAWPLGSNDSDSFTTLFAYTCMKNFYAHDQLRAEMAKSNSTALPQDRAAFFLNGAPGTAWAVLEGGQRYVVVLRDDAICAVYAQHAPVEVVQKNFIALVSSSPAPLVAEKLDSATAGPNSDVLHTITYAWSRPKDDTELTFTLTTSMDGVPVQAMASMAVTEKPNPSSKRTR
jgi:hypothetical protein